MRVHYIVGHRDDPEPAAIVTAEGLRKLVPDIAARDVYICGPGGLGADDLCVCCWRCGCRRRRSTWIRSNCEDPMTTRKVVFALAGTATGALLLIGAKGAQSDTQTGQSVGGDTEADVSAVPAPSASPVIGDYTVTGPVVQTPFGPVQVKVDDRGRPDHRHDRAADTDGARVFGGAQQVCDADPAEGDAGRAERQD